jgi:hypothetical protein
MNRLVQTAKKLKRDDQYAVLLVYLKGHENHYPLFQKYGSAFQKIDTFDLVTAVIADKTR